MYISVLYLRGHIVRGAAEGVWGLVQIYLQLAHPEVHQADVALVVQKQIVQLQVSASVYSCVNINKSMIVTSPGTLFVNELIAAGRYKYCFRHTPVNNPLPVQELEGAHNLRRVEPGSLCFKPEQGEIQTIASFTSRRSSRIPDFLNIDLNTGHS